MPLLSVIIPTHDSEPTLGRCLRAVGASTLKEYECIVVDDGSSDASAEVAESFGVHTMRLQRARGPAAARNRGAIEARGEVLVFIDADVEVKPDTLARIAGHFETDGPDALMGSYDDAPPESSFFSRYKNLFHHYIHQTSDPQAQTFWAGCGAVRRAAFLDVGGFNEGYRYPSIEDIELGYRLHDAGYSLLLDSSVQATHLKRWTFVSMVATDVGRRGIPWCRLMLKRRSMPADLNTRFHHQLSTLLVFAMVAVGMLSPAALFFGRPDLAATGLGAFATLLVVVVALNARLYRFFARKAGPLFAFLSIPMHLTYYLYSGVCLLWALLTPKAIPGEEGILSPPDRSASARRSDIRVT